MPAALYGVCMCARRAAEKALDDAKCYVPQRHTLMVLADTEHKPVVDMRADDVFEDLEVQRPELFPGLAAVIRNIEEVECNVVVEESFRQCPRGCFVILHTHYPHLIGPI